MKIKAYDKYHKQWIYIEPLGDEIWNEISSSNRGIIKKVPLQFSAVDGDKDNCDPKRWRDLEQFSISNV